MTSSSGGNKVAPSASNIKMVKENLALSIALWAAAQRGVITAAYVPGKTEFKALNDATVEVDTPLQLGDNRELVRCINNQIRGSFAFSAIQTHRTMELTYKGQPLQDPDPDLKAARCALYLLSNTMSRDLLSPVWVCPPDYRHRFEVKPVDFTLDASILDGKEVLWDDFGGLQRYMALLQFCSDQVEKAQEEAAAAAKAAAQAAAEREAAAARAAAAELAAAAGEAASPLAQVADFVAARCAVSEDALIIAKEFYQAYIDWCQEQGQQPLPQRTFGMQLTAQGFQRRRRGKGKHWWVGVGLLAA